MSEESIAHLFIRTAVDNHKLKGRDQINVAMRNVVYNAVAFGLNFDKEDFHFIRMMVDHEYFYAEAIRARNISAAVAFEKYAKRKPFFYDNVNTHKHHRILGSACRARSRLAVRFDFIWKGERVTVTSIVDKPEVADGYLIACSYQPERQGYAPAKIKRRFKIKHSDLKKKEETE